MSSLSQPGRWHSDAAASYASECGSVERDDFSTTGRSLGRIGGEPAGSARRRVLDESLRSLNDGTVRSFGEAFEVFEERRPGWRQELANAPPRTAPGAHVFDVSTSEVAAVSAQLGLPRKTSTRRSSGRYEEASILRMLPSSCRGSRPRKWRRKSSTRFTKRQSRVRLIRFLSR